MKDNYSDEEGDHPLHPKKKLRNLAAANKKNRGDDDEDDIFDAPTLDGSNRPAESSGKKKNNSKHRKNRNHSDDEQEFVDSSEEDEDEPNEYQYDGFLVDGDEDEEEAEQSSKKKRSSRERRSDGEDNGEGDNQEGGSGGSGGEEGSGGSGSEEEEEEEEDPELANQRRQERRRKREEKKKKKQRLHRLKKIKYDDKGRSSADEFSDQEEIEGEDDMDNFVVDQPKRGYGGGGMENREMFSSIFGDDEEEMEEDEDGDMVMETEKSKDRLALIREQYEPSLLEEKHFTDADEQIRTKNIPERFQTRKGTVYVDERTTLDEAEWIYETSFNKKEAKDMRAIDAIVHVLKAIQKDFLEVPYIYTYDKDFFEEFFNLQDLWTIFDLDEKWNHIKISKKNLEQISSNNRLLDNYQHILNDCKSEENISDLYDLFQMMNGVSNSDKGHANNGNDDSNNNNNELGEDSTPKVRQKRAIKRDLYTVYHKARIGKFLPQFGMSAQEFGQNLMENYLGNTQKDPTEEPSTAALAYICLEAGDTNQVLQAARYMMAQEMGFDPFVRHSVRMIYKRYAHITTTPTLKGYKEIDAFHPFFTVKSIFEKPAHLFNDTQYLLILKAEKEGFIKSTMGISEKIHDTIIIPEMENLYLSDGTSAITQQWNEQRKKIIREALTRFLYPILEKELRNKLLTEASNRVAFECAQKLEEKIRVGPWRPKSESSRNGGNGKKRGNGGGQSWESDEEEEEEEYEDDEEEEGQQSKPFKIFSMCWGADKVPTMGVVLDINGEVINHVKLDFLCDRLGESLKDKKEKDVQKLRTMFIEHQPRLILISASEMDSKRLYEEMTEQVNRFKQDGIINKSIAIEYSDPEIGLGLQNSARYAEEFKEYPTVLKHAIAIGRCVLDPIVEYASLCNDSNEILYLKLHYLQDMIGKDFLLKLLHRCFINIVNAIGVDINRMIKYRFTSPTLQFVSGLGSRKAQMLLNLILRRGGYVSSRASIAKLLDQNVVYKNCIGFIQIKEQYLSESDADRLDETRIHPEGYEISYRIAAEALDKPHNADELHEYIYETMRKPKKLDRLDFDAFSDILEKHNGHSVKKMLALIKRELTNPFADIRSPYRPPNFAQIFQWLTGETDQTLRPGTLISATTIRNFEHNVKCRLDNGLEGTIPSDNISDNNDVKSLPRGLTLNCRVINVDKERFGVTLSCKESDLSPKRWEEKIFYDLTSNGQNAYLKLDDNPPSLAKLQQSEKKKPVKKERKVKRTVIHPLWHSFTCLEAENYLRDKQIGEPILRPSSKGFDHITVTFKFWDDIILHHDIKEADKPNAVSLGKSFYMGDVKFDSLDEILARHVEYLINNLNEIRNHQYWKNGTKSEIDEMIKQEKLKNPKRLPYYFGIDHQHPGFIILYHVPTSTPRHEPILIKSDGYVMRKQNFPTLNDLIKFFKQNYAQLLQNKPSSNSTGSGSGSSSGNNNQQSFNNNNQQRPQQPPQQQQSSFNNNNRSGGYQPQTPSRGSFQNGPQSSYQPKPQQPYQTPNRNPIQSYNNGMGGNNNNNNNNNGMMGNYQQQPKPYQTPNRPSYPNQGGNYQQPPPQQQQFNQGFGGSQQNNWNQPQQGGNYPPPPQQQYGGNFDNRGGNRPPMAPWEDNQQSNYHPQQQRGPPPPMYNNQPPPPQYGGFDNRGGSMPQQNPPYGQPNFNRGPPPPNNQNKPPMAPWEDSQWE